MAEDYALARDAFQDRHLDVGRAHHIQHGGAAHPYELGGDDKAKRGDRQREMGDQLEQALAFGRADDNRVADAQDKHEEQHQKCGSEEFRRGHKRYGHEGQDPVIDRAGIHGGHNAQSQRDRDTDRGRQGRYENGILVAVGDQIGDGHVAGERGAEIALHKVLQPGEILHDVGLVEAEPGPKRCDILGRGGLAEADLRRISGQDFCSKKDD